MIPRIIPRGHSFKGAIAYITHDPDQALSSERVAWTATGNMLTQDPAKAAKVMAWTDINADVLKQSVGGATTGRKVETGSVAHDILSWVIADKPSEHQQREAVESYLQARGLADHQYVAAGHHDTDHLHVHIVVNLTHPETGHRANSSFEKRRAQAWALAYEREHGIHCNMRALNAQQRAQENAATFYRSKTEQHGVAVTRAYELSDSGQAFAAALQAEGITLARGRKSFVAVDQEGEILSLPRVIDGAKTKDIKAKLGDLDHDTLQDADALAAMIKERMQQEETERQKTEALDMLVDMIEDELEDERNSDHDTEPTPDRIEPTKTLDREEMQDMQTWDDLDDHNEGGDRRKSDMSTVTHDDTAEYSELHPVPEQDGSGAGTEETRQAASGEIQDHARDREDGKGQELDAESYDSEQARIDADHALLDGADIHAQMLDFKEEQAYKTEQQRQFEVRQSAKQKSAQRTQQYSMAKERTIETKIKHSEELHQQREARKNLQQAQDDFDKYNSFWRKLFQYEKYWEAKDTLENRHRQFEDAEQRARDYMGCMNSQRPSYGNEAQSALAQEPQHEKVKAPLQNPSETQKLNALLVEHAAEKEVNPHPVADQLTKEYRALIAQERPAEREPIRLNQQERDGLENEIE